MKSSATEAPLERACPLCGRRDAAPLWPKGELRIVRCRECAMVFASPVAAALADGSFYDQRGESYYLSPAKLEGDYAPVRFARELRILRKFCRRGRVLDVGCSSGAFLFQLQQRWPGDYDVLGSDVTEAALAHAEHRGVPVRRGSFLELGLEENRFDAVTFWAVLEHLIDPQRFLDKAARLLRSGGHCFILVPNLGSLAVRLLGRRYRYVMPDHLNYFSRQTLTELANAQPRFELVRLSSTHFNPVVVWQDLCHPSDRVPDAERAALLQRTTGWKQNPRFAFLRLPYAAIERVLGRAFLADNLVAVLRRQ